MDFDWNRPPFNMEPSLTLKDVEESFEDPFALKLLPDSSRFSVQARFFNLGVSASGAAVFSVYRTNGKQLRVIYARPFQPDERFFYQKKMEQMLSQ